MSATYPSGATDAELASALAAFEADVDAELADKQAASIGATDAELETGVGVMLKGWIPTGWHWIVVTQTIENWDSPANFTTLDGLACYTIAGAPGYVSFAQPSLDTWTQNSTGVPIWLTVMAGVTEELGENGHVYLITSSATSGQPTYRLDFMALRTGPAGS